MKSRFSLISQILAIVGVAVCLPTSALAETPRQWIETLRDPDTSLEAKARACQRIGEAGHRQAGPELARLLPDPVLNAYARAALERLSTFVADDRLLGALSETTGAAQIGVVQTLGRLRELDAVEPFIALLDSTDKASSPGLAEALIRSLGQIGTDKALDHVLTQLQGAASARRSAAASACFLRSESLRRDSAENNRHAKLLYEAVLEHGLPSDRVAATRQLLLMAGDDASAQFLEKLQSEDPAIRDVTLLTLRERPSSDLADALHQAYSEASPEHQRLIVMALRDCANENTVSLLVEALDSSSPQKRPLLYDTLAHLGGPQAATALLERTDEEASSQALIRMKGSGVDSLIVRALQNSTSTERDLQCIQVLSERFSREAIPAFLRKAASADAPVQRAALEALRPMAGPDQVPALIAILKATAPNNEAEAVQTLASACRRGESTEAVGAFVLSELESAPTAKARQPWARLLVALGHSPALEPLARELQSPSDDTAESAIELLSRWPGAAPVPYLLPLCQRESLRDQALRAVLRLLPRTGETPERVAWLEQSAPFISTKAEKQAFIGILGSTPHPSTRELLRLYLKDADVREEVKAAQRSLQSSLNAQEQ